MCQNNAQHEGDHSTDESPNTDSMFEPSSISSHFESAICKCSGITALNFDRLKNIHCARSGIIHSKIKL